MWSNVWKAVGLSAALAACSLWGEGKSACRDDADCLDGRVCNAGMCGAPLTVVSDLGADAAPGLCDDLARNGEETDVDCGGPTCPACALGRACALQRDCAAGTCDEGVCRAGRWQTLMSMPTARSGLAAAFGKNGRLYALGGTPAHGDGRVVEVYDPARDIWSGAAPMELVRRDFTAVGAPDGRIFAIGGPYGSVGDPGRSRTAEAYDVELDQWSPLPDLTDGRFQGSAVVAGGEVYVVGGVDGQSLDAFATVERWDSADAKWVTLGPRLLTARRSHAAAPSAAGEIFVFGGMDGLAGDRLASVEQHLPGQSAWTAAPPLGEARFAPAAALGADGKIYLFGGFGANGPTRRVDAYDPVARTWTRVASLSAARYHLAAAAGPDGRIYVVGGHDGSRLLDVVEAFTP